MAERIADDPRSPWWPEHRFRYHHAAAQVAGRRVLDAACGWGTGREILHAARPALVVALDADWSALSSRPASPGQVATRGDAARLPFAARSFDVICSFETIEHLPDPGRFVDELARVLGDDGVLLLSTPNAEVTKPLDGTPRNPFHLQELMPDELRSLLAARFESVEVAGQRTTPEYGTCVFWTDPDALPLGRARLLAFKAALRVPFPLRDLTSRILLRRPFHPCEHDFRLTPDTQHAHVLVATCRRPRR